MSNLVQYGKYELETADEEKADLDSSGGGANFLTLKEGNNVVRFLPPPLGTKSPFYVIYQHYIKPTVGDAVSFACPKMMAKQRCPVCEKSKELSRANNKADKDAARELYARRRVFSNVIDRSDQESGPKILAFGKTIQEQLNVIRRNKQLGGDYTDPMEGFDIVIERKGTGLNTKYTVNAGRGDSELGNMEWIAMQHDLSQFGQLKSYEDICETLGMGSEPAQVTEGRRQQRANVVDAIDVDPDGGAAPSSDGVGW